MICKKSSSADNSDRFDLKQKAGYNNTHKVRRLLSVQNDDVIPMTYDERGYSFQQEPFGSIVEREGCLSFT